MTNRVTFFKAAQSPRLQARRSWKLEDLSKGAEQLGDFRRRDCIHTNSLS
jgi:hypothetical protein